jgi:hypothetical protein
MYTCENAKNHLEMMQHNRLAVKKMEKVPADNRIDESESGMSALSL